MVNRLRELEGDVKVALTGDSRGICTENPAAIRSEELVQSLPSGRRGLGLAYVSDNDDDEEDDAGSDASSDADQVCALHAALTS